MPYRFSLATVLRFRESIEKREEIALEKSLLDVARARIQIEQLTRAIADAQDALNEASLEPMSAFQLQNMISDIDVIVERKKALVEVLKQLERERETRMKAYQAAHRDRQMLSDMATRQRDVYEQERARAQQSFLDDMFATRSRRN